MSSTARHLRRPGERYELLGGYRRRAAFLVLREREPHDPQWRTIPAVIRTASDEQADLMLISSQTQRASYFRATPGAILKTCCNQFDRSMSRFALSLYSESITTRG